MKKEYLEAIHDMIIDSQSAAICLALSNTISTEEFLKNLCVEKGYKCVVTEFGGNRIHFSNKVIGYIIAACIDKNIIKKNATEIHAVVHAAEEAAKGFLATNSTILNIAMKIAVARDKTWISVAFAGYSALHHITNHRRVCTGTMHI